MTTVEGPHMTDMAKTAATLRDEDNQKYFFSGWEAALKEVLFIAEHRSAEEAIAWAREHLERTR